MLLDTLLDDQQYMNSTLIECLREQNLSHSYKTIQRRQKSLVDCYINVHRDPISGMRLYTGKQIRAIIEYERGRNEAAR